MAQVVMARSSPALRSVTRLWMVMAALSALVWCLAISSILVTLAHGKGFPLGDRFPAFEDIVIYRYRFAAYHTAAFFHPVLMSKRFPWPPAAFAYPPAAALVYAAIYTVSAPDVVFTVILGAWTVLLFFGTTRLLGQRLQSRKLTAVFAVGLALFSFPLIFLADRSNIELFVWMDLTAAVLLYRRGHAQAAAVLIGLAASVKLYPILLIGLFFNRRRDVTAAVTAVAVALTTTAFAIWYAGPTFAVAAHGFFDGVVRFKDQHAETARAAEAVFDHSFFSPFKIQFLHRHGSPRTLTGPYYLLAAGSMLAVFLLRVRRLPLLNRLVFLSAAMISLPPVSYEYTIIHLYLPMLLLLLVLLSADTADLSRSHFAALGTLLFLTFPLGLLQNGQYLLAGQLQAFALACLAVCAAIAPWTRPETRAGEPA